MNDDDPNRLIYLTLNMLRKLYEHILQEPAVKVYWSFEVTGKGQDEKEVWVEVKTAGGRDETGGRLYRGLGRYQ